MKGCAGEWKGREWWGGGGVAENGLSHSGGEERPLRFLSRQRAGEKTDAGQGPEEGVCAGGEAPIAI